MQAKIETIDIPFRGQRNYVYGPDIVGDALQTISLKPPLSKMRFAGHRLLTQSRLERGMSYTPLSSREWDSAMSIEVEDKTFYIGYRPVPNAPEAITTKCSEGELLKKFTLGEREGMLIAQNHLAASPIEAAVAAAKAVSHKIFPTDGVKWVFAAATLEEWPENWSKVHVKTDLQDTARFVRWDVSVDEVARGHIVFYRGEA